MKKKNNYFNEKVKELSKKELLESIAKVERQNKEIDRWSNFSHLDLLVKCSPNPYGNK